MTPLVPGRERDFVLEYARQAPLALALERALECRLLAAYALERPVLDIGCGDGLFAETLYGSGAGIDYGLDIDLAECARARRRDVYTRVINADAGAIPLADATVRTVLANSTLEHLPRLHEVLRETARVLASGGELYVTLPTDRFAQYANLYRLLQTLRLHRAAEWFRRFYDRFWRHYHYHAPDQWARLLEAAGFHIEEVIEYDSPSRCALHDVLVPFAFPAFLTKKLIGRYALVPSLRGVVMRGLRGALPSDREPSVSPGTGGLVFLRAVKL